MRARAVCAATVALLLCSAAARAQAPDPEIAKLVRESPPAPPREPSFLDKITDRAALSPATPSSQGPIGTWIMRPPPVLYGASTVYDPVNDRLVVACGSNGFFQKNVWTLSLASGSTWQLDTLASAQAPAAFAYAASVYDPVHARMVMFGGLSTSGGSNQLWSLSTAAGLTWVPVTAEGTPPSPRWNAVSAYDSRRNRLLVYGGETSDSLAGDAWALELGDTLRWTRLDPVGAIPPGHGEAAGAFDPIADRLLVYGGYVPADQQDVRSTQELWQLDLGDTVTWRKLDAVAAQTHDFPYWTPGTAAVFDPIRDRMYVLGGEFGDEDAWALDPTADPPAWNRLPGLPLRRLKFSPVYDASRDCFLVYGGADSGHDDCDVDVLSFSGGLSWSSLGTRPIPTGRENAVTIFDSRRDRMVVFSGEARYRPAPNDTWANSLPTGTWTRLATSGESPSNRLTAEGVYDSKGDRFFLFGTDAYRAPAPHELWVLALGDLSATWQRVTTAGDPPPSRRGSSLVYDPVRDRLLLFGGFDFTSGIDIAAYNDVWSLSLDESPPRWSQLHTLGQTPVPRAFHSAAYDPIDDRMIVFGGFVVEDARYVQLTNEIWALSLGPEPSWKQVLAQGTGPLGPDMPMIFDSIHQRFLFYAGPGNFNGTMWALNLKPDPAWQWLPTVGPSVPGRGGVNLVYDPLGNRLALFGGSDDIGVRNDLWTLEFSPGLAPPPAWIVSASAKSGAVHLVWGSGDAGAQATVFRQTAEGNWSAIAQATADALGEIQYVDASPENRWTQTYRLGIARDGTMSYSVPITVQAQETRHPLLSDAYPNPWRSGAFQLRFQLPAPGPGRLEMVDVRGRVVWATDVTPQGPAPEMFRVAFRPRSGLYLMRLSQGGDQATLKTVVLQ
jgi:hypothetical protein